jgi:uncharacterized protein YkwD
MTMENVRTSISFTLRTLAGCSLLIAGVVGLAQNVSAQNTQTGVSPVLAESRPRRVHPDAQVSNASTLEKGQFEAAVEIEKRAFQLVNETRVRNGLPLLIWDQELCELARVHSQNMAKQSLFSHVTRDGLGPKERAVHAGIKPFRRIAENIAYNWGFDDPGAFAVERWMTSSGHRENILDKQYKASAVGVFVKPNGAVYITQVFISR